jgi:hypothetical protein
MKNFFNWHLKVADVEIIGNHTLQIGYEFDSNYGKEHLYIRLFNGDGNFIGCEWAINLETSFNSLTWCSQMLLDDIKKQVMRVEKLKAFI